MTATVDPTTRNRIADFLRQSDVLGIEPKGKILGRTPEGWCFAVRRELDLFTPDLTDRQIFQIWEDENAKWRRKARSTVAPKPETAESSETTTLGPGAAEVELAADFLRAPSHGLAVDILARRIGAQYIYDPLAGTFWRRDAGTNYYEREFAIRTVARKILEESVNAAFELERTATDNPSELFKLVGRALQRGRTRDFLAGAVTLFSEAVTVPEIKWNATPETIPTITTILDFSGAKPIARPARDDEYFRAPIPTPAEAIVDAKPADRWNRFMAQIFPDPATRETGRYSLALLLSGRASKTFQVWHNGPGHGGKNSLIDSLSAACPGRIAPVAGALILKGGDSGERRFGAADLEGLHGAIFDEVGGNFDIAQIKRLTSLSELHVERKGEQGRDIPPTWNLVALTNKLPAFTPADDHAFLSRLLVIPFDSVFYADEETRSELIRQGIPEKDLHPARPKAEILHEMRQDAAAILRDLTEAAIELREKHGYRPPESPRCRAARAQYRTTNDDTASFLREYLFRDNEGFVANDRLEILYREFSGQPRPAMKQLRADLTRRFPWIRHERKRISDGMGTVVKRGLGGVRERDPDDTDPETDPKIAESGPETDSCDNVTLDHAFFVRERKNEKSSLKEETGGKSSQRHSERENSFLVDPETGEWEIF